MVSYFHELVFFFLYYYLRFTKKVHEGFENLSHKKKSIGRVCVYLSPPSILLISYALSISLLFLNSCAQTFHELFFGTEGVFLYELECVSGDEPADLTDLLVDWEFNSTERVWFRSLLTEEKERVAMNISNKTSELLVNFQIE